MKKLLAVFPIALCLSAILASPSIASNSLVLDFEDVNDGDGLYHSMAEHSPYTDDGIMFFETDGPFGEYALFHYASADYASAHSGVTYLFNPMGYDCLAIGFSEPVVFDGAWVAYPTASYLPATKRAAELWFEGYLGEAQVAESAKTALGPEMQWSPADFGRPVDRVVFRRSTQSGADNPTDSFYTVDDITFTRLTPPLMLDNLRSKVADLGLPSSVQNTISTKIDTSYKAVEDDNENNDGAAVNHLEALIKYLEAQRGKRVPAAEADQLIDEALQIIARINQ